MVHCIDEVTFEVWNVVILLWKYKGKTEIAQGKYKENTGNFVFRDEWEPCLGLWECFLRPKRGSNYTRIKIIKVLALIAIKIY